MLDPLGQNEFRACSDGVWYRVDSMASVAARELPPVSSKPFRIRHICIDQEQRQWGALASVRRAPSCGHGLDDKMAGRRISSCLEQLHQCTEALRVWVVVVRAMRAGGVQLQLRPVVERSVDVF